MITRILAVACLALALAAWLLWSRLDAATERAGGLQQQLREAIDANASNQAAINDLRIDITQRDQLAAEAIRQRNQSDRLAAQRATELERLKSENADLASYLDSPIPRPAADWLWLRPGDRDQDRDNQTDPTRLATAANPGAANPLRPTVTEEQGWRWCKAVEAALDSCNGDKVLLREWVASD